MGRQATETREILLSDGLLQLHLPELTFLLVWGARREVSRHTRVELSSYAFVNNSIASFFCLSIHRLSLGNADQVTHIFLQSALLYTLICEACPLCTTL